MPRNDKCKTVTKKEKNPSQIDVPNNERKINMLYSNK